MTNGERIKYLREKNGFTQKDIATRLGVEPATISKYELDKREPDIAFCKLLKLFSDILSLSYFSNIFKIFLYLCYCSQLTIFHKTTNSHKIIDTHLNP